MTRIELSRLLAFTSIVAACASGEDPTTGFGPPMMTTTMPGTASMTTPTEGSSEPTTGPGLDMGSGGMEPPVPMCGDGKVEGDEECDLGGDNDDAGECTAGCKLAVCGDGLVQDGVEACDDGNPDDDDDCTSACEAAGCGDGIVGPGEACDDGNMTDTDGCTNACALAVCGDGIVGPGEACDDGNKSNPTLAKHPRSTAPSLPGPIRCLAGVLQFPPEPDRPRLRSGNGRIPGALATPWHRVPVGGARGRPRAPPGGRSGAAPSKRERCQPLPDEPLRKKKIGRKCRNNGAALPRSCARPAPRPRPSPSRPCRARAASCCTSCCGGGRWVTRWPSCFIDEPPL